MRRRVGVHVMRGMTTTRKRGKGGERRGEMNGNIDAERKEYSGQDERDEKKNKYK